MQSWGSSSKFQQRETNSYPTKSGIIGLLAAALGIDKHSPEEELNIEILSKLKFDVRRLERIDQIRHVQRLQDFHTIGGGWDDNWKNDKNDTRSKLHIPAKAGDRSPFGTVITHRTYLTDARFVVLLEGDAGLIERIFQSLLNPTWGVWFGRKCCLPASPLSPALGESHEATLKSLLQRLGQISPGTTLQFTQGEEEISKEGSWLQADQPISYGKREFASRPVARIF